MHQEHIFTSVLVFTSVTLSWPVYAGLVSEPAAPSIYAVDIVVDPTFQPRVYVAACVCMKQDVGQWHLILLPERVWHQVLARVLSQKTTGAA